MTTPQRLHLPLLLTTTLAAATAAGCRDKGTPSTPADTRDSSPPLDSAEPPPACVLDAAPRETLSGELCVSAAASCQWTGTQASAYLGYSLDAGGDLDGDGRAEVLIGANLWDSAGGADQGMVAVLWSRSPEDGPQPWHTGQQSGDALGSAVALLGDVDGDGQGDALVGARGADLGDEEAGAVYLISGASGTVQATLRGEQAYARAGISLAGGDLDGDGLADLALAGMLKQYDGEDETYGSGRVALFYGGAGETWASSTSLTEADAALTTSGTRDALGRSLHAGADVDGDGYGDLVVGAPYASGYRGQVMVIAGGATRWSGEQDAATAAAVVISGTEAYAALGWSLGVGDVDGDGVAEIGVGAPLADQGWNGEGAVRIYGDGGQTLRTVLWGELGDDQLGTALDMGSDVDGDGWGDVLIGAIQARRGMLPKSGRLYLVSGAQVGHDGSEQSIGGVEVARVQGAAAEDYLGSALALADVDGDGRGDVVAASGTSGGGRGAVYLLLAPEGE